MIKKKLDEEWYGNDEYLPVLTRKKQTLWQRIKGYFRRVFIT